MFDKVKTVNKWRKAQAEIEKQMEQIQATVEKGKYLVVVNANNKIIHIDVDGEEDKVLKDAINGALKDAKKKAEKKLRSQAGDLGLGDLLWSYYLWVPLQVVKEPLQKI